MLSKAGDRLTLMGAPYELSEMLGMELRAYFPKKITADRATEDGRHIFEIKRSGYGGASRPLFAFLLPDSSLACSRSRQKHSHRLRASILQKCWL